MGIAHLEIATQLHRSEKYEIASFGWFWSNASNRGIEWNLPWQQYTSTDNYRPYGHPEHWPNSSENDLRNTALFHAVEKFKPDVVIGIGDVWMLDYVRKLPNRKSFKFIWEFPIDGEPIPSEWVDIISEADVPIVMSKYAADVIHNINPHIQLTIIPRGIDLRLFKPITPIVGKNVLRKEHMPKAVGKFVVGIFDRFQDRKQIFRGIEAFHKFITNGKIDDAILYLHMDINDSASMEQGKKLIGDNGILNRYGLLDKTIFDENLKVERGVDVDKLVYLYNCCDVKIAPTQGEGWGLTNVEAMACGVPVIATNYTTLPEIIGDGRGLLTDVKSYITGMYNVERALVDTDHMAAQIDSLYRSPELRRFFATNALKWVGKIDWSLIMPWWEKIIDQCTHKPTYRLETKPREYKVMANFVEATLFGAIKEDTGWAITTRGLANGLEQNGVIVRIEEGGGSIPGYKLDSNIESMLNTPKNSNIHIINHMPETTVKLLKESKSKIKVAFFPFELPKLNPLVVESLNRDADIYLGPSQFCVDMAKAAGVRNAKVLNIHSDIDLDAEPYKFSSDSYRFLCVGNLGDSRKNTKLLVKAFVKTFTGKDNVCLVLKSLPGHKDSDPSAFVDFELKGNDNPPKIIVIHSEVDPSSLYKSCDCLVQPSRSEGFCAPIYEALHFGMPIITTGYGGQIEHAQASERVVHLSYKIEDASESPIKQRGDVWAEVDFTSLCCSLRNMYEAKRTRDENFSIRPRDWKNTGKQLIDYFNSISNTKKIKIFFENQEKNLWNNDNNINLKRYAHNRIDFVDNPSNADLQIVNITRLSDINKIKCSKYIVLFHCRGEWSEENIEKYRKLFDEAIFVYSHQDLKAELPDSKFLFKRGPWGTDDWNFYTDSNVKRKFKVINTGLVAETEAIKECLDACEELDVNQVHIGLNLWYKSPKYFYTSNLSVEEMRGAYNSAEFVSGMRRIEGFEKPVIEGLLCGARPICFDTPLFRYWYDGLAEFVPECAPEELTKHLVKVFKDGARPVTDSEKELAIKRFGWKNVAINFWDFFDKVYK